MACLPPPVRFNILKNILHICILFKKKDRCGDEGVAEELCLQVKEEGADFYTLARRYSQDEATRPAGGYLGRRRRRDLSQGVAPLVFAASEGEVVGPVKVEKGYALYYVQKRCPAVLDETTCEKIRKKLFESYLQREMKRAEITFPFVFSD
ncbi:MAG: peptidylprolyl isomerase [Gemmatimonadota bacterium]|nr:peptidylprolyl isomerase [Gemmatimonadota bacterium]MDE2954132.1 peptidylprolyl isomerase [Gemmatimonadota bacterium]